MLMEVERVADSEREKWFSLWEDLNKFLMFLFGSRMYENFHSFSSFFFRFYFFSKKKKRWDCSSWNNNLQSHLSHSHLFPDFPFETISHFRGSRTTVWDSRLAVKSTAHHYFHERARINHRKYRKNRNRTKQQQKSSCLLVCFPFTTDFTFWSPFFLPFFFSAFQRECAAQTWKLCCV